MIEPRPYRRKTFNVSAIQVTSDNIKEVAKWCGGKIRSATRNGSETPGLYVLVPVGGSRGNAGPDRAFIGHWVLRVSKGFKVYTNSAFNQCFEPVKYTETTGDIDAIVECLDSPTED